LKGVVFVSGGDHSAPAIAALMRHSFDQEYRQAICSLGERGETVIIN